MTEKEKKKQDKELEKSFRKHVLGEPPSPFWMKLFGYILYVIYVLFLLARGFVPLACFIAIIWYLFFS